MLIESSRQAISCRDILGLPAEVYVWLDDNGDIVVVTPQRDYIRLKADESMLLRAALEDAEGKANGDGRHDRVSRLVSAGDRGPSRHRVWLARLFRRPRTPVHRPSLSQVSSMPSDQIRRLRGHGR